MSRKLIYLFVISFGAQLLVGRTQFILQHEGRPITGGEVCFVKAAPEGGAPDAYWFQTREVRCLPADRLLDIPAGRFHFFARADGLITASHNMLASRTDQPDESLRRVVLKLEPSAFVTLPDLHRSDQWIAILAAKAGRQPAIFFATPSDLRVTVPADAQIIPLLIAGTNIVAVGDPLTLGAGATQAVTFNGTRDRGRVVTWIEFDRAVLESDKILSSSYGSMATHLVTPNGAPIASVAKIQNVNNAHGQLQVFVNVPPGPATIVLDGDRWERNETSVSVTAGQTVVTREPILAVPAATIRARYAVDRGPLSRLPDPEEDCQSRPKQSNDSSATVTFVAYRCHNGIPVKNDTSQCTIFAEEKRSIQNAEVLFTRLEMGTYIVEARHRILGTSQKTISVLPAHEAVVDLSPHPFPIFGRVQKRGHPVVAGLTFAKGTPAEGKAVSGRDGRYEVLLRGDPRDNSIEVDACDRSFHYEFRPTAPPAPNAAFDIDIPAGTVTVKVRDRLSGKAIPNALVIYAVHDDHDDGGTVEQTSSDQAGTARFTSVTDEHPVQICASAASSGYVASVCSDVFHLARDEEKDVQLSLDRTGRIRGRLVSDIRFDPPIMELVSRAGHSKGRVRVDAEGTFSLVDPPASDDYFVLTGPGQPLYVLSSWSLSDDNLLVTVPAAVRIRSFTVRAPNMETSGRLVGLVVRGLRVPQSLFYLHLANRRINVLAAWKNGLVIPEIAELGPISVILGPKLSDVVPGLDVRDFFTQPEAARLPAMILPPDRDELAFP